MVLSCSELALYAESLSERKLKPRFPMIYFSATFSKDPEHE